MTRSEPLTDSGPGAQVRRPFAADAVAASSSPFSCARVRIFSSSAWADPIAFSLGSTTRVSKPASEEASAIPRPMTPAPITATARTAGAAILPSSRFVLGATLPARNRVGYHVRDDPRLYARERDALLVLVLAALVLVRDRAVLVALEEEHLRDPFVRVDPRGQGRRVRYLQGDVALPLGLQWGHVGDDPAPRVRRLPDADRHRPAGDAEIFHAPPERERIRRHDADVPSEIDQRFRIEVLGIHDRVVDVRKDLELVRDA